MENDFWLRRWQTNDIRWHNESVNQSLIDHIDQLQLQPGQCILVPLCGKSQDMLWLANQGYHVVGIELSSLACNDFFKELNVEPDITHHTLFQKFHYRNIDIYCADIFKLAKDHLPTIHAIYDCKALIALPPDMRKQYVDHLIKCLGQQAPILLQTIESTHPVQGPPFSVSGADVRHLYGDTLSIRLLARTPCITIPEHLSKRGYLDLVDCTYLISP